MIQKLRCHRGLYCVSILHRYNHIFAHLRPHFPYNHIFRAVWPPFNNHIFAVLQPHFCSFMATLRLITTFWGYNNDIYTHVHVNIQEKNWTLFFAINERCQLVGLPDQWFLYTWKTEEISNRYILGFTTWRESVNGAWHEVGEKGKATIFCQNHGKLSEE